MEKDTPIPPRNGEGDHAAKPRGGGGPPQVLRAPIKDVKQARQLRRQMSVPEILLWQQLRKRPGDFKFRQVKYANVVAHLGSAPKGAKVHRPEIHHDDTEVCWVTSGRIRLTLPHETVTLGAGDSIQFDAIQQHGYEALADSEFVILHLRKDKRY